jgi:galactonate dehydratase
MNVSNVECLPAHAGWRKNFVFVRVETDAGIVGWGEAYSQYDRHRVIAAQVEELGRVQGAGETLARSPPDRGNLP